MSACKIVLLDEVNCKVRDIEPATIRRCINALKFTIPHARHLPSYKLGRWDGTVSFFSAGGNTQINMLDKILPILEQDGYEIDLEDLREPIEINLPQVDENVVSDFKWPKNHPTNPNEPIILKEHQVEIVNNFLANPKGIQVVPTSGGKTIITATLSKLAETYGRTVVIVPNKQLVTQTEEDYKLLGLDVGVYFGDRKDWYKMHTICTWQSLGRLYEDTKKEPGRAGSYADFAAGVMTVIVDEAHGAKADELRNIMTRVFNKAVIRWGLTGTMPKAEYESISIIGSIGPIINTIRATELQEKGVLSKCEIHVVQLQDERKFKGYHEEHDFLCNDIDRVAILSSFITNIGATGNTLVLVQNVKTGKYLQTLVKDSVFINGNVEVADRKEEYDLIATENNKVIIATYGVASTGINVPRIFNLVLLEPGKSFIRTIQSIGRSLRRAHDKENAVIYDICSNCKYSKRHLTERKKYYKEQGYPFQVIKLDPKDL